ncbi:LysR family transcriptional regulator [Pseudomonas sp. CCC3.1]|uniref:LysR family transcriptional regulator n=1 Tax=Pseudomonas sp. CCC3.1 TaxID=3048607 RepID=UPI002AC8F901|nr:LysR family transcriptional regulator [Pseudomonas sp. CCC3.1]MEB0208791.1 LysR family transcriptional regulator [Pseudomonas sp. CCC3.1]WPX37810.1 LysR family transcriptional regulator [Pseudomonas sp. CCC3.1]
MADVGFNQLCNWLRFRHLVLIDTLARTQNMHATAQEMNISQPAVSKMLREIEHQLGFDVFARLPRSMSLTDLGSHVARFAQIALNDTQQFVGQINHLRQGGHGFLKIGTIYAATAIAVPAAIVEVKQQWPLLTIEVLEGTSANMLTMLEHKQLDLVVARFTLDRHRELFDFQALAPEPLCLVTGSQHPLAGASEIPLNELGSWPWVLYPTGTPMRARLERAFVEAGMQTPENTVETVSLQTTMQLLQTAPVVAMLAESMAEPEIQAGRLTRLALPFPLVLADYGIITRRNEPPSWSMQAFIDALLNGPDAVRGARQTPQ